MHPCPAFVKPDRKTLENLKRHGDVGVRVTYTRKGRPVVYVWQMFTFVRLTLAVARELRDIIDQEEAKYRVKSLEVRFKGSLDSRRRKRKKDKNVR